MAKAKKSSIQRRPSAQFQDPQQTGLRAFYGNRFGEAILAWTPLVESNPQVRDILAEAHIRRALSSPPSDDTQADLRRAIELVPGDPRGHFHLGRYLHLQGDLPGAIEQYRATLKRDASWTHAAKLLALATVEQNPQADLTTLPGYKPEVEHYIAPVQALLRATPAPAGDDGAVARFWRGLSGIASEDPGALNLLQDERPLPNSALVALRRYYRGIAAAQAGDTATALKLWQHGLESSQPPSGLSENLAVLVLGQLAALGEAGDVAGAATLAHRSVGMPGNTAFDEARIVALDHGAHAAAAAGNWSQAAALWEAAREILSRSANLGSPRPLLHNLGLAYERQERWEEAAEAWRAMLRTRPRRKAASSSAANDATLSNEQWAWVRERIITCYKNAGRPDEAVVVFRQMIKDDPQDLDSRVQLADALQANQQDRAAHNEIERILKIDPQHVDALLRHAMFLDAEGQLALAEQVMRSLVEQHPERHDLAKRAAQLFLQHGRQYAEWHQNALAYQAFVDGERFDPENYLFPINQARMLLHQAPHDEVRALVDRAIAVAGDQFEPQLKIIETWVIANRIDEARAQLDRLARDLKLDARNYVDLAVMIIMRVTPPPTPAGLFPFLGAAPPSPVPPADTPWTRLATELFDQAIAMQPNDIALQQRIASELILPRPDLALRYAEAVIRLAPDDPEGLLILGTIQGLSNQIREAKATFQRAAQLARKQGNSSLARQAQDMRRAVGTPMFRMGVQMSLMGVLEGGIDLEDLEDFLE